ncbi:MAG: glycerol-3-phosphate 1-O-acyltransferase, partial [Candidatus Binatia bacterium]
AFRLRDLMKFEFFFAEKEEFRAELAEEMRLHDPDWERKLADPESIHGLVRSIRPFNSHRVLRPFLEAYRVVGDALERLDPAAPVDEAELLTTCMNLGRQLHLQRRIRSAESVSRVLFANALRLAANRRLLGTGEDVAACRAAFADELRHAIRRVDAIDALAASRRAGLID